MNAFTAALWAELAKFRRSPMPLITTLAIAVGIPILAMVDVFVDSDIDPTWLDLFNASSATSATGALIGFGVLIAWLFGREFVEGTITGLFAIPIGKPVIAGAKLALFLVWALVTGGALLAVISGIGMFLDLGAFDWTAAIRQLLVTTCTAVLVTPCALIATATRSYFAPIGSVIGIGVLARIAVSTSIGDWFPFSAPAMWASTGSAIADAETVAQLGIVLLTGGVFAWFVLRYWRRLRLA
ncbi:MAG: ABC transporter permease [Chloroflexi bacterium]|nr:ABC transporter permease [Chloroflexota bacterium]